MSVKTAFLALLCAMPVNVAIAEGIDVLGPYAMTTGVGGQTGAAFMAIQNHGDTADALIDVRSDAARRVELHQHVMSGDGMMSMVHVTDPVTIPAGGELMLDRGGFHIMFMGLTAPLVDGTMVPLTLIFEQAGEILVEVPVDQARIGDTMEMGNMDMSSE